MTDLNPEIENRPLREEEHGPVNQDRANYAVWLKRWTFVAIPVAIYTVVAAALHLVNWNSGLHIAFVVESAVTLVLVGALTRWFIVTTREHEARTDLSPENTHSDTETTIYFISTLVLVVFKVVITLNAHLLSDRVTGYLTAQASNPGAWSNFGDAKAEDLIGTLNELRHWYMIANLFLTIYLLLAARGVFWFINNKKNSVSYLIYISIVFVVTSALLGVGDLNRLKGYDSNSNLSTLNPIGALNRLCVVLIITAAITFFIWLTTFRRWRSGAFILSVVLLALGVVLITSDGFVFRGARATDKFYVKNWHNEMDHVNKNDLEAAGCPNKYTESAPQDNSAVMIWEKDNAWYLMNKSCSSILGDLYSGDYYEAANLGLVTAGFLVLVGAGFYYFWYVAKHELHTPHNAEYAFLGLLIVAVVCTCLGVGVNGNPLIMEHH